MRASFYEGRAVRDRSVPVPAPARGEALLRVRRVGICGTDLHIFQGHLDHRVPRGGVIGHETFAEVVEAPKDSGFVAVTVSSSSPCPLRRCRACRMGARTSAIRSRCSAWTCRADARVLSGDDRPPAEGSDALGDDAAAVIERWRGHARRDARGVKRGDACSSSAAADRRAHRARVRQRGAEVVVSRSTSSGSAAGQLGSRRWPGRDAVNSSTNGRRGRRGRRLRVTGRPEAVRAVTDVVRVWGTISIVAIHSEPMPVNLYQMFARELTMHGSRCTRAQRGRRRSGSRRAARCRWLAREPQDPLERSPKHAGRAGGANVMKVLVEL